MTKFRSGLLTFPPLPMGFTFLFLFLILLFTIWREYSGKLRALMLVHLPGLDWSLTLASPQALTSFLTCKVTSSIYRALGKIMWVTMCKEPRSSSDRLWALYYSWHICGHDIESKKVHDCYTFWWIYCLSVWNNFLFCMELFVLNSVWANVNIIIVLSFCLYLLGLSLGICVFVTFLYYFILDISLLGFPGGSDGKESACNAGDPGLIPELRRSPGEGNSHSLQYSYLENPMDRGAHVQRARRGAWWAAVYGVAQSWTRLKRLSSSSRIYGVTKSWTQLSD